MKAWFRRPVGGHYAVTRSLLAGLRQNGVSFSYNPPFLSSCEVIVLSGVDTLRFAIEQKAAGRIKFLAAGPNICVLPSLCDYLVANEAVDLYVVNSEWTRRLYVEDCPALDNKIAIWPSGVDVDFWVRRNPPRPGHVLIYLKNSFAPLGDVERVLESLHMCVKILRYGEYDASTFKAFLESSECMIYMGGAESQGIALAEAWAMDVPTFVWAGADKIWPIPAYASSAPYLSEHTGELWIDSEDLAIKLIAFFSNRRCYTPRSYVLHSLTDKLTAKNLLRLVAQHQGSV
ncbi:glycosyltransferase family 4 protein [Desulfomicrobium norvegicum]|uniref:glycosyltransferase family 4 protein n=1 Tax=Desulfomicrobium norvegicum (strain DSM 1741 / NCIMB 8310) TaxID=52561 RepID=UPI001160D5DB|nr:glycosyltransferase family 4 protein [Desulfomicrobium norvegicum]